jgi:hypothetical protein
MTYGAISRLPITKKILVVFGSFVNGSKNPRDIDILQRGMTIEEITEHIQKKFQLSEKPTNLDIHEISTDKWDIEIPVPCDSRKTNYKVIYCEPPENKDSIPIRIARCTGNISSVLRDETKSVEDIIAYLSDDSNFSDKGIPVNIGEFDRSDPSRPSSYSDDYVNGRLSLINAVQGHLGEEKFKQVCDGIWWGKLLFRIYKERPTKSGFEFIQRFSPIGAGPDSASFWVSNKEKLIYCTHGYIYKGQESEEIFIYNLYGDADE